MKKFSRIVTPACEPIKMSLYKILSSDYKLNGIPQIEFLEAIEHRSLSFRCF